MDIENKIIMSKFVRVESSKFERVAQAQQPLAGAAPTDLLNLQQFANPLQTALQQQSLVPNKPFVPTPAQAPATPAPVNPANMFARAGIDQRSYVGNAEQNERLRAKLMPSAPTFYDAYVKAYGKWDMHPNDRIEKLNGNYQIKMDKAAKEKAIQDAAKKQQELAWKNNMLNPNNPNGWLNQPPGLTPQQQYAPTNPPNYQNLFSPQDPFRGIQPPVR